MERESRTCTRVFKPPTCWSRTNGPGVSSYS